MANSDNCSIDKIEARRSNVRRYVTYAVITVYLLLAGVVVVWLMCAERYDLAIGVLSGVAGIAGSITGFWFGARRPNPPEGGQPKRGGVFLDIGEVAACAIRSMSSASSRSLPGRAILFGCAWNMLSTTGGTCATWMLNRKRGRYQWGAVTCFRGWRGWLQMDSTGARNP